jgi:hypothetical protein
MEMLLINRVSFLCAADDGLTVEKEVNELGPGEAVYIPCDVRKEDQIKVTVKYHSLCY